MTVIFSAASPICSACADEREVRQLVSGVEGRLPRSPFPHLPAPEAAVTLTAMIDMLVRLYDLPDPVPVYERVAGAGYQLRRARAFERHQVMAFAGERFSPKWASEVAVAMARQPVACFIATRAGAIHAFACFDTTARGYFGPTGVAEEARGSGLGQALLLRSLEALRELGHHYAIIGGVGPREFYEKAVGAIEIPGSDPGAYADILPETP